MGFIGLSVFLASLSFLYYRCPPSTWLYLPRARRQSPSADRTVPDHITSSTIYEPSNLEVPQVRIQTSSVDKPGSVDDRGANVSSLSRQDVDSKAMPPPPLPAKIEISRKKQIGVTSGSSDRSTPAPSHSTQEISLPVSPALHSAQRASRPTSSLTPDTSSAISSDRGFPTKTPQCSILPNRDPRTTTNSLSLPPTHTAPPTKPRQKVLLQPGHSPLDWARLSTSPLANLSGLPPGTAYLRVPPSLLRQQTGRKGKDAWTVLGGKVYNISPYLPYHPGGEAELLRAAGRHGTRLFGEIHPWVNWEGMLEACLVGIAVDEETITTNEMDKMD